jgi:hypothetical protein
VLIQHTQRRRSAAGQALVLMALALVALLAMVGLVIDGGSAWANQRITQNGSDAAAEAGAVIMAERFGGGAAPSGGWDAAVAKAVADSATANGITVTAAYYTDICGIPLTPAGTAALNSDNTYNLAAADQVGSGSLPANVSSTPDCPSRTSGPAAGVLVLGHKSMATSFANVVGITTLNIGTQSTAAAGALLGTCDASNGEACALLPVVIPTGILSCATNGNANPVTGDWKWDTLYVIPLCKNNADGNVGWLNWGNGTNNGTDNLITEIQTPNNPAIALPSWQDVTATGNVNSQGVQNALAKYFGQEVMIPMFDLTCGPKHNETPDQNQVSNPAANNGCLNATTNDMPGSGTGAWYRIPSFAHFQLCISSDPTCNGLDGAYVNGSPPKGVDCGGNGSTGCLVGKFVDIISTGTIGPGVGGSTGKITAVGVQLIK